MLIFLPSHLVIHSKLHWFTHFFSILSNNSKQPPHFPWLQCILSFAAFAHSIDDILRTAAGPPMNCSCVNSCHNREEDPYVPASNPHSLVRRPFKCSRQYPRIFVALLVSTFSFPHNFHWHSLETQLSCIQACVWSRESLFWIGFSFRQFYLCLLKMLLLQFYD